MNKDESLYKEILTQLISFDTTSSKSNLQLIDYLSLFLEKHGFRTQLYYSEENTKANLIAVIGPETNKGLMLAGHTDVVPVEGQLWETNPFQLTTRENALIGRGTADMKGYLALACEVASTLYQKDLAKPLYLVFTYDEEVGCFGAKRIKEALAALSKNVEFALIGEPTNFALVNAHKGIQVTKSHFLGKPAHSSFPDIGKNAILAAAEFLHQLPEIFPSQENKLFDPPKTTFNAGTITGGNAVNIIAEQCLLEWEYRPLPDVNIKDINEKLKKISETIYQQTEIKIHHSIESFVPGLSPNLNKQSLNILKKIAGEGIEIATVPFVTEAGLFEQASIPSIVCGPGDIKQAHQPNECVSLEAMERYRQFLYKLVNYFYS